MQKRPLQVAALIVKDGRVDAAALDRDQHAATDWPGWPPTPRRSSRCPPTPSGSGEGRFGEIEALITQLAFSEYCAQIAGGIPMSQGEIIRLHELGLNAADDEAAFLTAAGARADPPAAVRRRPRARLVAADPRRCTPRPPSATPAWTRPTTPCARKCAASPTPRWFRMPTNGIWPMSTSPSTSSTR